MYVRKSGLEICYNTRYDVRASGVLNDLPFTQHSDWDVSLFRNSNVRVLVL